MAKSKAVRSARFQISRKGGSECFRNVALAVHGGAGVLSQENITVTREARYLAGLRNALEAGLRALQRGRSSLDAVEAAVKVLEDCPLFNAGKGAVLTIDGHIELDAAIMDGASCDAGAVASVRTIKNPVSAARAVMQQADHVLFACEGAERFARHAGLKMVAPEYFMTQERQKQWQKLRDDGINRERKFGTVGAVALDSLGNLAAATSTGGMMNKGFGRVGDSPLIGAGTYADNRTCAVSCTGHGEYFIRYVAAYDVAARMDYAGHSLHAAANYMINQRMKAVGGEGGLIALDTKGNCALPFNTEGMFRGCVSTTGEIFTAIYR
jgi:beta-aspartyl-peptidase (threonine type)